MTDKMQNQNRRAVKGMSQEELADSMRFFLGENKRAAEIGSIRYLEGEVQPMLAILTAELERRENGGKILADLRAPYMTDGEYFAAGLEPPSENN